MSIVETKQPTSSAARTVGDLEVTAVFDGLHRIPFEFVLGVEPEECRRLTAVADDHVPISVNCFLVRAGRKTILVDAGGSTTMAGLGKLPEGLRALGVTPDDIDLMLLTHLHRDHSNGLIDDAGRAVFGRAELLLHEAEARFYLDRMPTATNSERLRRGLQEAQRNTMPYRDRIRRIAEGEVLPGITAVLLPGHTPGHTGWLLASRGERLLIWGDIIHVAALQVPRPDAGLVFDVDVSMARATRAKTFEWVERERLCVAGAHLDFPGFGTLARDGDRYRYLPA